VRSHQTSQLSSDMITGSILTNVGIDISEVLGTSIGRRLVPCCSTSCHTQCNTNSSFCHTATIQAPRAPAPLDPPFTSKTHKTGCPTQALNCFDATRSLAFVGASSLFRTFFFGDQPVSFHASNTSSIFLQMDDVLGTCMGIRGCCSVTIPHTGSSLFLFATFKNILDISTMHLRKVI
jgi:hypothetical protein